MKNDGYLYDQYYNAHAHTHAHTERDNIIVTRSSSLVTKMTHFNVYTPLKIIFLKFIEGQMNSAHQQICLSVSSDLVITESS